MKIHSLVLAATFLPVLINSASILQAGDQPGFARKPVKAELLPIGEDMPDWLARWELARVLSYVERYDESIAEYQKLLKQKPDLVAAKTEMAQVLHWASRNAESLAVFDSLEVESMGEKDILTLADILVAEGEFERAEKLYSGLLDKSPDDRGLRLRYAEILSWTKQYDKALKEYEKLIAETPQDIQLRRKYAITLQWAGRIDEAISELKKTLDGQNE